MGNLFSSMFGQQKMPKIEFKQTLVEPINLSLKSSNKFSLDDDTEKPKSLFSYFGGSDSKTEKEKKSFMDSFANKKSVLPFGASNSDFKPVILNSMVKQATWAIEKFPTFEDDNQSGDDENESKTREIKEFRKRVHSFEVTNSFGTAIREAGFLSIEK